MAFRISSPAFADGADIPVRHTCDGEDRSPLLTWAGAPRATRSFALIVDDPDAPRGTFTHWLLFDLPADTTELAENVPAGTVGLSGRNGFGRTEYGGPCPPPGDDAHRYRFTLHALDVPSIGAGNGATRSDIEGRMEGHVLALTQLIGTYRRRAASAVGRG